MSDTSVCTKNSRYASFFRPEKSAKNRFLDAKKMPLQHPLDAIMMLTFFDAVVIAIATCSYRDDNMMLSTCVHVAINLANATYFLHKQNTRKKDCINIQKRHRRTGNSTPLIHPTRHPILACPSQEIVRTHRIRTSHPPRHLFLPPHPKKTRQIVWSLQIKPYLCTRNSGCSSARLEYTSGGRVVAGSNPVTPTDFIKELSHGWT